MTPPELEVDELETIAAALEVHAHHLRHQADLAATTMYHPPASRDGWLSLLIERGRLDVHAEADELLDLAVRVRPNAQSRESAVN